VNRFFYILFFLVVQRVIAQSIVAPGDYYFDQEVFRLQQVADTESLFRCSFLPSLHLEYLQQQRNDELIRVRNKMVGRKLFNEDLLELHHVDTVNGLRRDFNLVVSPLMDFRGGFDLNDTNREKIFQNTRGLIIRGAVAEKFQFESVFLENQSTLVEYQDAIAQDSKVIPGNGRWKKYNTNGYDYAMSSGYVLYRANKHLVVQAGHGKHKIGSGYRSLLLSDNAFNYPYARIETRFFKNKIQYTSVYALLMNLTGGDAKIPKGTERIFQKKPAAFHHLSFQLHKRINLSFFQSLIWSKSDSMNRMNLDATYFNPIIFSNLAIYGFQDSRNILTGMDIRIQPLKRLLLFGQFLLDENGSRKSVSNKSGWQAGLKVFDLFSVQRLFLQLEYNTVRPFTYSSTDPGQSYTHYAQPIAHPAGANFSEALVLMGYRYKRFFIQGKVNYLQQGLNLGTNYGQNIFLSDFNPALPSQSLYQGITSETIVAEGKIGCLLNPKTNLNVHAGFLFRSQQIATGPSPRFTNFVYVGCSTSLFNTYWDF
jgi:hypothetical protein